MSVLSLIKKPKPPEDAWYPASGVYPSLFDLAGHTPALDGKGGVYALWHLGVRPQWLRIGAGADLLGCLRALPAVPQVAAYRGNGGLFVAWTFPEAARAPGIILHLQARLEPVLQYLAVAGEAVLDPAVAPVAFPSPPGTIER
ncbi:MAG: hypothetical protein ACYCZX_19115 [Rhodospirillaceae bacterium]